MFFYLVLYLIDTHFTKFILSVPIPAPANRPVVTFKLSTHPKRGQVTIRKLDIDILNHLEKALAKMQ